MVSILDIWGDKFQPLTLHLKEKEKPQTPDYMKCLQGRGATGTLARAAGGRGETLRPCRAEADALPV